MGDDPFVKAALKVAKPRPHWPKDYSRKEEQKQGLRVPVGLRRGDSVEAGGVRGGLGVEDRVTGKDSGKDGDPTGGVDKVRAREESVGLTGGAGEGELKCAVGQQ